MIPPAERFWAKVDKSGDCWLWMGARNDDGYGIAHVDSHVVGAHRLAYELAIGPIPEGLLALHHCDRPPCCRPAHLWLGTQSDNIIDSCAKGRWRQKGIRTIARYAMKHPVPVEYLAAYQHLLPLCKVSAVCRIVGIDNTRACQIAARPDRLIHYRTLQYVTRFVAVARAVFGAPTQESSICQTSQA